MIKTLRSIFSKEIESVRHLQGSCINHSAWKINIFQPDFPSQCDCDVLFLSNYFGFNFVLVLGAEKSGFKLNGGHSFSNILNSLHFSGTLLVFEINVLEKDHSSGLVLKLLLNSNFLTKCGPHTTQAKERLRENYYFIFNSRKTSGK